MSTLKYPSIGPFIIHWMETNLVHGDGDLYGQPYRPPEWLKLAINHVYRFDPDNDFRRLTERALFGMAKGTAKTEGAAAWAAAEFAGPVVPWDGVLSGEAPRPRTSPDVPIAAASYDQARLCFGAVGVMVSEGELAPHCEVLENRITFKHRPGRLYRVAAEAGTNDGTLPTAFFADEVHEWVGRKARVHTVIGNSLRKRTGGLEVSISTAGDPAKSDLLLTLYEYHRRVSSGELDDPAWFSVWQEASDQWDLSNPDQLLAACREAYELAPWIDPERIAARYHQVKEHEFRRYHLNQWVTAGETWLPAGEWEACSDPTRTVPDRTEIAMAFDGSHNGDSTALYGCTLSDPHLFEIGVWEKPSNATADWRVPRHEVDAVVDEAFKRWQVREMACDPARWNLYLDAWADRYGDDRVIEYPQTRSRMAPATSRLYDAVTTRAVTHDGSPTLARHVANAAVKEFPGGYMLVKDHPNRLIDAAVAAVMAFDRATVRAQSVSEPKVTFI